MFARRIRKPRGRNTSIFVNFACGRRSSSDGVAIRYVLPVLRTMSCFHTMGPMGGRTSTHCCVARRHQWTWPMAERGPLQPNPGSLARRAGLLGCRPGRHVLAVRRLDSAAAGDGGVRFVLCYTLVVSCAPRARSLLSMIALFLCV